MGLRRDEAVGNRLTLPRFGFVGVANQGESFGYEIPYNRHKLPNLLPNSES